MQLKMEECNMKETMEKTIFEVVRIKQEIRPLSDEFAEKIKLKPIGSPKDVIDLVVSLIGDSDRENFLIICLNTKNEVNAVHIAHIGSLNASIVSPREIYKSAILNNSNAIICAHNHPSYNLKPSSEDLDVTRRIAECGDILGIELLDHIIVNNKDGLSLKEKGYF